MAGTKDTPRQKLISLMYLVLMALLAMNVSGAILDKFFFLDKSLSNTNLEELKTNRSLINNMSAAVLERGNKMTELAAFEVAQVVRSKTERLHIMIDNIRDELLSKSGGIDIKTGKPKGMDDQETVAQVLIGVADTKSGKGYELKNEIKDFVTFLNKDVLLNNEYKSDSKREKLVPLTMDANDNPMYKHDRNQSGKDWVELNFESTPVIAAFASLSDIESKLIDYENRALALLAEQVGIKDPDFDNVVGMYRLKSSVVAAGSDLEGDLFVSAFSSYLSPKMTLNGQNVVVENGIGKFKKKVSATSYDADGYSSQKLLAKIELTDTSMIFPVEYQVARPFIQIMSKSVKALYRSCGNVLKVNVPALGSYYNPSFSLKPGEGLVRKNPRVRNEVVIIPEKRTASLSVSSNGNAIGMETFRVKSVPLPSIEVKIANVTANITKGVRYSDLRKGVSLKAIPDKEFAELLPKDARYTIAEADLILVKNKRPVKRITFPAQNRIDGNGERLLIEIKELYRINYAGKREKVNIPLTQRIINIPLVNN